VVPIIVLSLGLSGIGLPYVAFLTPYQQYLKIFSAISLFYSHYLIYKGRVSKNMERIIWISTVLVIGVLWLPALLTIVL